MSAVYSNKFRVEVSEVVRIEFQDELGSTLHSAHKQVLSIVAEIIQTRDNARQLAELILRQLDKAAHDNIRPRH